MASFRVIQASILLLVVTAIGCNGDPAPVGNHETKPEDSSGDGLNLVATTGQVNSALVRLTAGTGAQIKRFCGPGVDPHSFSASTGDVQAMIDADAIFYNGFHLEAKLSEPLHDTFAEKAWAMSSAFPEDERLEWMEDGEVDPDAPFDPHIWNHLPAWAQCVRGMADRLAEIDPANAETYSVNADNYISEIESTHTWAAEQLEQLPEDRRVLVSAHDAFNYFTRLYNMEPLAVLGIGNDPEADIATMREVAVKICDEKVPAIFMESITNPKVTEALQAACADRNWKVEIVNRPLYSDDLGESAPQDTFLGAFKSNVEIIRDSLMPSSE